MRSFTLYPTLASINNYEIQTNKIILTPHVNTEPPLLGRHRIRLFPNAQPNFHPRNPSENNIKPPKNLRQIKFGRPPTSLLFRPWQLHQPPVFNLCPAHHRLRGRCLLGKIKDTENQRWCGWGVFHAGW